MPQDIPEISLGHLAQALNKLQPKDEATRLAIAKTLGMGWVPSQKAKAATKGKTGAGPDVPPSPQITKPTFDRPLSNLALASRLEHNRSEKPAPSIYVQPLKASAPESETKSPPLEPLFFPRWTRGILSAGLATNSEVGAVDVDLVVRILASGRSVEQFPLLSLPTLNRGVQLLIDRSQAMEPFIKDQAQLHKEILNVVGPDRVTTLRFVGCPTRGAGVGPEATWSEYEAPLNGAPVLLLTDLGIGRPRLSDERSGAREWLYFAYLVRKAKSPLIAFVPYGEKRWPPALRTHISIIQWDRSTTAITVSNKLKTMRDKRK